MRSIRGWSIVDWVIDYSIGIAFVAAYGLLVLIDTLTKEHDHG